MYKNFFNCLSAPFYSLHLLVVCAFISWEALSKTKQTNERTKTTES